MRWTHESPFDGNKGGGDVQRFTLITASVSLMHLNGGNETPPQVLIRRDRAGAFGSVVYFQFDGGRRPLIAKLGKRGGGGRGKGNFVENVSCYILALIASRLR